jgi:hypothetical protein
MLLRLSCLIRFTDNTEKTFLEIPFANDIEIDKSRKTLTNTAKISLARKMIIKTATGIISLKRVDIDPYFRRGLQVEIFLGYNDDLTSMFTGYIARVDAKIPFTIYCEDEMWNLKQNSFTKNFGSVKVSEVVKYVYPGAAQVVDLQIGGIVIKKASTAQVLQGLKKFGLQCYFFSGTLIVDFAGVVHNKGKEVFYDFQKNIIDNDLEYKSSDDIRVKVRAVSKLHTGGKIEIVSGDNDGAEHTLHYVNLDKTALQKIVDAEIAKLKAPGFKNGFTTFGMPLVEPGDIAVLNDDNYKEHNGSFLVESVKTTWGGGGYRHNPIIERKLA